MFVVTLSRFTPPKRYDAVPWTGATVQEAATSAGPWVDVETFALAPDPDPANPAPRNFTTELATIDPAAGWYRVRFTDASAGVSYSAAIGPSGYPTTDALVAASTVDELTDLSADEQDALRIAAITAIEQHTRQVFEPRIETRIVNGTTHDVLRLPARLEAATAVLVHGTALDADAYRLDVTDNTGTLTRISEHVGNYAVRALHDAMGYKPRRAWDYGTGGVSITGTWGWSVVPPAIVTALRLDMEDQAVADANGLASTVRAYAKLGLKNISQGNLRADFADAPPSLSPRVMRLLDRYVWQAMPGRLV